MPFHSKIFVLERGCHLHLNKQVEWARTHLPFLPRHALHLCSRCQHPYLVGGRDDAIITSDKGDPSKATAREQRRRCEVGA